MNFFKQRVKPDFNLLHVRPAPGNLRPAKFFNFLVNFKPLKVEEQYLYLHFSSGYKRETGSSLCADTHVCSENDRRVSENELNYRYYRS